MRAIDQVDKLLKEAEQSQTAIAGYIPSWSHEGGPSSEESSIVGIKTSLGFSFNDFTLSFQQGVDTQHRADNILVIEPVTFKRKGVTDEKLSDDVKKVVSELLFQLSLTDSELVKVVDVKERGY